MTLTPKIRVKNLTKVFGRNPQRALDLMGAGWERERILKETGSLVAVSDISFEVEPGEIFVVMGLSGSGKSTLIRCLNRLVEPTEGQVLIDDEDILKADEPRLRSLRLSKLAMVFQQFALFPNKSVIENAEFGLKIKGIGRQERRQRAMEVLEQVGLGPWADKYPASLSGGMQQRVGLARSLATGPEILLMDEAFSALDPLIRRDMQLELLALQEKMRKTIVFITHDLHEALLLGSRIAIMKEGRFVQVSTPQEIVAHPANDYVSAFTRDVDRGRIFSVMDVLQPSPTIDRGANVNVAIKQLEAKRLAHAFVTDAEDRPLGFIALADLKIGPKQGAVQDVMERQFPQVLAGSRLVDIYETLAGSQPIAVVDDVGRLLGTISPTSVFRKMAQADGAIHS